MQSKKLINILMVAGIAVCLLQIWLPQYYLTGDGPCHVYNAKVLHDLWLNKDTTFYYRFYTIVYQPNPNWLSHILLAIPMSLVSGVVAEKLFLTFYALLYAGGLYLLLKKISGIPSYWLLLIFLFIFNHALAKGFYNFSLATAFYSWMAWSWLRFIDNKSPLNTFAFFAFSALIFFTQLLPFIFGWVTCFALIVTYTLAKEYRGIHRPIVFFAKNMVALVILTAPFLALMQWFTAKEGGLRIQWEHNLFRIKELVAFKYLISASGKEFFFAAISGIAIISFFIAAVFLRFRNGFKVNKYDGFLLSLVFVFGVYLLFPEQFMGRVILMAMRVQLFVFLLLAVCAGYMLPVHLKNAGGGILFACFLGISIAKLTYLMPASAGVADYLSGAKYIKPYSVILPLDFAPAGIGENGAPIAEKNYIFTHAAEYIGAGKPLIFLDNYEALAGYFPLLWTYKTNPYAHLSREEGIEGLPPCADIEAYEKSSGEQIDYVIMWCYNPTFLNKGHYQYLAAQIAAHYHLINTSPSGRALLYERNR